MNTRGDLSLAFWTGPNGGANMDDDVH
jgi:hypothetical protein